MTDFPKLLLDLRGKLGSDTVTSERTGIPAPTIRGYINGRYGKPIEPKHSRGEIILELHKRVCKK